MSKGIFATLLLFASWSFSANPPTADVLIRGGHYKQARALLEPELKKNPKSAGTLLQMARVKMAFGDTGAAIKLSEQVIQTDGKNANAHCMLADASGSIVEQGPRMLESLRLARQAKKEAEAGLALNPKLTQCLEALVDFYNEAPASVGGSKDKREEYLQRMVQVDPVAGNLKKGVLALNEKQLDKAEAAFKAALAANPHDYLANIRLAELYRSDDVRKYDLAEKFAHTAISLDPTRTAAYTLIAQVLTIEGKDSEVNALLGTEEKLIPDDLAPHYQVGRLLLLMNRDFSRAEKLFRKYLTQEPESEDPFLAAAHWRLAGALEKQGKKAEAISELEIAVKLRPDLEGAKQDLKRLKG